MSYINHAHFLNMLRELDMSPLYESIAKQLFRNLMEATRSSLTWFEAWTVYQDVGGVRSSALALGRVQTLHQLYLDFKAESKYQGTPVENQIIEVIDKATNDLFNQLTTRDHRSQDDIDRMRTEGRANVQLLWAACALYSESVGRPLHAKEQEALDAFRKPPRIVLT